MCYRTEVLSSIIWLLLICHPGKHVLCIIQTEWSVLPDGQIELRAWEGDTYGLETVAPGAGGYGLLLRRVTDGKHILTNVYNQIGELTDCEITTKKRKITKLLRLFKHNGHNRNTTAIPKMKESTMERHYRAMLDTATLKTQCKLFRDDMEREMMTKTKIDRDIAGRTKRAVFIYPGTNWCGDGNIASSYNDLGVNADADKCCRAHDHCPQTIESFVSKFNLFNYRFHTLSHCRCDFKFMSCLKMARSDVANWVGSLYFNVVQNKCFRLRKVKECRERSWWGTCVSYRRTRAAVLKEPPKFKWDPY